MEVVVVERLEALVVRHLGEQHGEVVGRDSRVDEAHVQHRLELRPREVAQVVGGVEVARVGLEEADVRRDDRLVDEDGRRCRQMVFDSSLGVDAKGSERWSAEVWALRDSSRGSGDCQCCDQGEKLLVALENPF